MPCYNRDRNWKYAVPSKGVQGIDYYHWKLGRVKKEFYAESQRAHSSVETFISDFWSSEL